MQSPSGNLRSPSGSVRGLVQQFEKNTGLSPTLSSRNGFKLQSNVIKTEFGNKDKNFNLRARNDDKTKGGHLQERQNKFRPSKDIIIKEEINDKTVCDQEHTEFLSSSVVNKQKCRRKNLKDKEDFQSKLPMSEIQNQQNKHDEKLRKIILGNVITNECEKNERLQGEIFSGRKYYLQSAN